MPLTVKLLKMLEYENKLHRHEKLDKNKGTQNYAHLKCRMEQKERENKELQAQLSGIMHCPVNGSHEKF